MGKNIFSDIPKDLKEELIESLINDPNVKIDRIVSRGHCSAHDFWYNQDKNEFVLLLQGEAKIQFKGEKNMVHMKKGDYLIITAHEMHRVDWTPSEENTIWLTLHY